MQEGEGIEEGRGSKNIHVIRIVILRSPILLVC